MRHKEPTRVGVRSCGQCLSRTKSWSRSEVLLVMAATPPKSGSGCWRAGTSAALWPNELRAKLTIGKDGTVQPEPPRVGSDCGRLLLLRQNLRFAGSLRIIACFLRSPGAMAYGSPATLCLVTLTVGPSGLSPRCHSAKKLKT